jgi:hypothetical protein
MFVAITPDKNFVGSDFDKAKFVTVVVAEIPLVFIIKVIGECVYCLMGSNMGFAFDENGKIGIGQGQGDVLVVVEVDEFLGVGAGGDEDAPIEPDKPDGDEMGAAIAAHGCQPNGSFAPKSCFYAPPPFWISSSHKATCPFLHITNITVQVLPRLYAGWQF